MPLGSAIGCTEGVFLSAPCLLPPALWYDKNRKAVLHQGHQAATKESDSMVVTKVAGAVPDRPEATLSTHALVRQQQFRCQHIAFPADRIHRPQSDSKLLGTWCHNHLIYRIKGVRGSSSQYKFEQAVDGHLVTGVLTEQGEWFQGQLRCGGSECGHIRVRAGEAGVAVSSFRAHEEDDWQWTMRAHRVNDDGVQQHLQDMYDDDSTKDICVRLLQDDGERLEIYVHSLLLRRCEYFAALLSHPFSENSKGCIEIGNVSLMAFEQLIKHLYAAEVHIEDETAAWDLFETAQYFQVHSLADVCQARLTECLCPQGKICVTSCLRSIERAVHVGAGRVLKEASWLLSVAQPSDVLQAVQCCNVNVDVVSHLLRHDIRLVPETELAQLILRLHREGAYGDYWQDLRMSFVDSAVLLELVQMFEDQKNDHALARLCRALASKSHGTTLPDAWVPRTEIQALQPKWRGWRPVTIHELLEADRRPNQLWVVDMATAPTEIAVLDEASWRGAKSESHILAGNLYSWSFRVVVPESASTRDVGQHFLINLWLSRTQFLSNGDPFHDDSNESCDDQRCIVKVTSGEPLRLVVDTRFGRLQCSSASSAAQFDVCMFHGPWALAISSPELLDCRITTIDVC
eukprot:TRINITY_DN88976_c0_g1_i1.p1 TRINITY_DN88976_c0_g1~~TRINITY_DN88976_c0_g1_i1.p1  ORF type:complete len:630 (-),score=71.76 TRINITY_DN88976_c0_g1_i1:254-2143(-)